MQKIRTAEEEDGESFSNEGRRGKFIKQTCCPGKRKCTVDTLKGIGQPVIVGEALFNRLDLK